jgi:hypothetical protein
MKKESLHVGTLAEYLEAVHRTHAEWERADDGWIDPWFRGVSNADFGLVPGLYRPQWKDSQDRCDLDEDDFRVDFWLKSMPYRHEMPRRSADDPRGGGWDEYCLMQHYGLPTRLLDWTESSLVALFFALDRDAFGDAPDQAAVWMLDPWWFNKAMGYEDDMYFTDEPTAKRYLPRIYSSGKIPSKPLAILVPYNSPRITAQRGLFTVHGSDGRGLEQIVGEKRLSPRLVRFLIPKDAMAAMRRQLRTAGVTPTSVFPDLSALCTEVKRDWLDLPEIEEAKKAAKVTRRVSRRILGGKKPRLQR